MRNFYLLSNLGYYICPKDHWILCRPKVKEGCKNKLSISLKIGPRFCSLKSKDGPLTSTQSIELANRPTKNALKLAAPFFSRARILRRSDLCFERLTLSQKFCCCDDFCCFSPLSIYGTLRSPSFCPVKWICPLICVLFLSQILLTILSQFGVP